MTAYPQSTQTLLDKATILSGAGFDIVYDYNLPISSSVKIAGREGREQHEIILRLPSDENNYLIAWQAAFVPGGAVALRTGLSRGRAGR